MKKIIIFIIVVAILISAAMAAGYYLRSKTGIGLEKLKNQYTSLTENIEKVETWQKKLKEDPSRVETYATLGIAWKSLAEKAKNAEIPGYENFYKEALEVYEKAIEVTQRKNTLFLMNAGNMAIYLNDFKKTEDYYREAITVAPGDYSLYIALAELYERLGKSKEEVVNVFEEGKKRVLSPQYLEEAKQEYLKRVK